MPTHIPAVRSFLSTGADLPGGLLLAPLRVHEDQRGTFAEFYREEWGFGPRPLQWNLVNSVPNTLRGVHTHADHYDYLIIIAGEMVLGLRDSRVGSPSFGWATTVRVTGEDPHIVVVPPGVSHGFFFTKPSTHVYGVTAHFVRPEEAICRWDDPDLGFDWPCTDPILSPRDAAAVSYKDMLARFSLPPSDR